MTAVSRWRDLLRPRRATRPVSRFRDSPWPCPRPNKRHFSDFCAFISCTRRISPLVALDNHAFSGPGRGLKLTLGPLVGAIAILAVLLVLGAILARGFSENGFRLGSQLAWRYASFVFVAALAMGPLCRITAQLFPAFTPPESLSRKLVWGFCAAYGVYLLSVFLPNVIHLSAGAMLMTVFGSTVVLVMAINRRAACAPGWSADPAGQGPQGSARHLNNLFLALLFPDGAGAHLRSAPAGCLLRSQPQPDDRGAAAALCRSLAGAPEWASTSPPDIFLTAS